MTLATIAPSGNRKLRTEQASVSHWWHPVGMKGAFKEDPLGRSLSTETARGRCSMLTTAAIATAIFTTVLGSLLLLQNGVCPNGNEASGTVDGGHKFLSEQLMPAIRALPNSGLECKLPAEYSEKWTVSDWLSVHFMDEYASSFAEDHITSATQVMRLQDLDLAYLGVKKQHLPLFRLLLGSLRASCEVSGSVVGHTVGTVTVDGAGPDNTVSEGLTGSGTVQCQSFGNWRVLIANRPCVLALLLACHVPGVSPEERVRLTIACSMHRSLVL